MICFLIYCPSGFVLHSWVISLVFAVVMMDLENINTCLLCIFCSHMHMLVGPWGWCPSNDSGWSLHLHSENKNAQCRFPGISLLVIAVHKTISARFNHYHTIDSMVRSYYILDCILIIILIMFCISVLVELFEDASIISKLGTVEIKLKFSE